MQHVLECRRCQRKFISENWKARFCGRSCYFASRTGIRRPDIFVPRERRKCRTCGKEFITGGTDGPMKKSTCSLSCAARIPRGRRRTRITARQMSCCEAAWFAGIVDGEGFIVLTNKQYPAPNFTLGVSNTSRELLERILVVTGCGRLDDESRFREHNNPYASRSWKWCAMTANAIVLLKQILPWLIVKKARAEKAIAGERWEPGFGLSEGKKKQMEATFGKKP
jgi:hypothetical protein